MKDTPLISVIVPNYNHADFLGSRLKSIYDQTYPNFEVILLDDCSTDGSRELLEGYRDHPKTSHLLLNEENSGSTFKQWEKGLELVRGDYVWIAESDDLCAPGFLKDLIEPHRRHPGLALSFCQSHRMNSSGEITGNWASHTQAFSASEWEDDFVMEGRHFIQKYLIHKNVIPNVSAVLFNRERLEEIRPLVQQPYMKYYADWYYYIQLLCTAKVAFVANSLNYFRYHDSSVIARAGEKSGWYRIFRMELKGRKQMMRYIEKCAPGNLSQIREQAKKGDDQLYYLTAMGFVNRGKSLRGLFVVWNKPELLKRVILHILKRRK